MNWQTVVEAIGIFGVGSGLFTWMIQSLAKQALSLGDFTPAGAMVFAGILGASGPG